MKDFIKQNFVALIVGFLAAFTLINLSGATFNTSKNQVRGFIVRWQTSSYNPASKPEFKDQYLTSITDTLGFVRGLLRDTSSVFETYPFMTGYFYVNDTTSTDSVDQTFFFYTSPKNQLRAVTPAWVHWALVDSFRVSSGPATTAWKITASTMPVGNFGYFISRGNAANKKTQRVHAKITMAVQDNS